MPSEMVLDATATVVVCSAVGNVELTRRTYLPDIVFGHTALDVAFVLENKEGGTHQTLLSVSEEADVARWKETEDIPPAPAGPSAPACSRQAARGLWHRLPR